jgi:hypothetical protein
MARWIEGKDAILRVPASAGLAMARRVEGTVLRRRCASCGAEHFDFSFCGDTDMVTEGLLAGTSPGHAVVGVREAGDTEWGAYCRGDLTVAEAAFQRAFGGPGWRLPRVLRWEGSVGVYACLECDAGECRAFEEVTPAEFIERGGQIPHEDGIELA